MQERKKKERLEWAMRAKKKGAKRVGREGEKEENETGTDKRRCEGFVSVEAVEICGDLSWEDVSDEPEDLSDRESEARVFVPVLDVTDVPASPSFVVTEFCDSLSYCTEWEFVEAQSCSFSKKRAQMRFEGPHVKAPPLSRRMMPPTPLQNSYSSFEEEQGHFEVEDQMWSARDRTVSAVPGRK